MGFDSPQSRIKPVQSGSDAHEQEIRSRIQQARERVAELDSKVSDTGFRQQLRQVTRGLDDIEAEFLGSVLQDPRTPAEKARWLNGAERRLAIEEQHLKNREDEFRTYGPDIRVIS
jgi:hypothetical protein